MKYIVALESTQTLNGAMGGRDRMVVGLATTHAISFYHHLRCEFEYRSSQVYTIHYYVMKFVSDLRQVGGFLRVFRFPPPIKLTAMIYLK